MLRQLLGASEKVLLVGGFEKPCNLVTLNLRNLNSKPEILEP